MIFRMLNGCDYGVSQHRRRIFIVGFRSDAHREFSFPEPTHSLERLLWEKRAEGAYWDEHEIARKDRPPLPKKFEKRVAKRSSSLFPPAEPQKRCQTVRGAIRNFPDIRQRNPRPSQTTNSETTPAPTPATPAAIWTNRPRPSRQATMAFPAAKT
ncbi:MAG: DNA cytosine methyltransferase [Desulfococcaceae bacterium]